MKLQQTRAASEYRKVRVSIPAFLTAAIAMSSTISKKQKIRFLVGVFDENDSGTFELPEFTAMISSFLYGVECMFGIANLSGCSSRQNLGDSVVLGGSFQRTVVVWVRCVFPVQLRKADFPKDLRRCAEQGRLRGAEV